MAVPAAHVSSATSPLAAWRVAVPPKPRGGGGGGLGGEGDSGGGGLGGGGGGLGGDGGGGLAAAHDSKGQPHSAIEDACHQQLPTAHKRTDAHVAVAGWEEGLAAAAVGSEGGWEGAAAGSAAVAVSCASLCPM